MPENAKISGIVSLLPGYVEYAYY